MKYILSFCLILCFCACASSVVTTQYYYLPNSNFIPPVKFNNAIEVNVNTADYLSSGAMVLGGQNSNVLHLASLHLWAKDLDVSIRNNLSNQLNQLGTKDNRYFSIYPNPNQEDKLEVIIEKFQSNLDGTVEITGYANLLNHQNNIKNSMAFQEKILQKSADYQGMINALDTALVKVSNTIYLFFW